MNPTFAARVLSDSLRQLLDQTYVADADGVIVGHLFGALLESTNRRGVWVGPDGASFDDTDVLADLYGVAAAQWIARGALEHYVWVLDHPSATQPWYELGFARAHERGVLTLDEQRDHRLPDGYTLRYGGPDDIELAVALDAVLDEAQRSGPSFTIGLDHTSDRRELVETLEDPEVHYYVVEHRGRGVAQCITFPLPEMRGSFEGTLHLSAVATLPEHRRRGIATAMVDVALDEARRQGFSHVETNWRVTNRVAARYWTSYGFQPTYVRLHRTIGAD